MKKIEKNLLALMDFIRYFTLTNGFPPAYREMSEKIGTSISTIKYYLQKLSEQNKIRINASKNRAIEIIEQYNSANSNAIPSINFCCAPIISTCNLNMIETENCEMLDIPKKLFGDRLFIVKNLGDALQDIAISDGDMLVVRKQEASKDGDLVVCNVNNKILARRFFKQEDFVKLLPENVLFKPQILNRDEVIILGKIVGIMRKF